MNETVIGKNICFDNLGIVEEDIVASNTNPDFGFIHSPNNLAITKVVGICDFVQGMSPVE
jgi:hypothetical protein